MDRRAFLASTASLVLAPTSGGEVDPSGAVDAAFEAWRAEFVGRAAAAGLPAADVAAVLQPLRPDPGVLAQDRRQPEFTRPVGDYIATTAAPARIADARARRDAAASWLDPIAVRYGTGSEILVAVWAVESGFGRVQGEDDVIRSLATLAAEGRRREFAESELVGALRILFSGEAARAQLKGSWAGAMGQTQFTPLDYLAYAVDGDGDGRRDIWNSAPDALASTANFLVKKAEWIPGGSPQAEVLLPEGFDYTLLEGPVRLPAAWRAAGVRLAPGARLAAVDEASGAALIAPMGWTGPAFFALPNHRAIRAYNNSTSYALAVGLLAAGIGGGAPLARPWPADRPIALADRIAAQEALRRLGLYAGPADGLFGVDTRRAARAWQARVGLPADGYLSFDLVQRLKAESGAVA